MVKSELAILCPAVCLYDVTNKAVVCCKSIKDYGFVCKERKKKKKKKEEEGSKEEDRQGTGVKKK